MGDLGEVAASPFPFVAWYGTWHGIACSMPSMPSMPQYATKIDVDIWDRACYHPRMKQIAVLKAKVNDIPIVFVGTGDNSVLAQQAAFADMRLFRKNLTEQWHTSCVRSKRIFPFPLITLIQTTFPSTRT